MLRHESRCAGSATAVKAAETPRRCSLRGLSPVLSRRLRWPGTLPGRRCARDRLRSVRNPPATNRFDRARSLCRMPARDRKRQHHQLVRAETQDRRGKDRGTRGRAWVVSGRSWQWNRDGAAAGPGRLHARLLAHGAAIRGVPHVAGAAGRNAAIRLASGGIGRQCSPLRRALRGTARSGLPRRARPRSRPAYTQATHERKPTMTDDLRQRRDALYTERAEQLRLRGCLLDAAATTGVAPHEALPAALRAAHDSYSSRITDLTTQIAELDRQATATKEGR